MSLPSPYPTNDTGGRLRSWRSASVCAPLAPERHIHLKRPRTGADVSLCTFIPGCTTDTCASLSNSAVRLSSPPFRKLSSLTQPLKWISRNSHITQTWLVRARQGTVPLVQNLADRGKMGTAGGRFSSNCMEGATLRTKMTENTKQGEEVRVASCLALKPAAHGGEIHARQ